MECREVAESRRVGRVGATDWSGKGRMGKAGGRKDTL